VEDSAAEAAKDGDGRSRAKMGRSVWWQETNMDLDMGSCQRCGGRWTWRVEIAGEEAMYTDELSR
jgi:hypothetical protein